VGTIARSIRTFSSRIDPESCAVRVSAATIARRSSRIDPLPVGRHRHAFVERPIIDDWPFESPDAPVVRFSGENSSRKARRSIAKYIFSNEYHLYW
jgi:hypothetical protein